MEFLHGVNLSQPYVCHNVALTGRLMSPNALAVLDPAIAAHQTRIESVPMDQLRNGSSAISFAPSPRTANALFKGGMLERGEKLYDGYGRPILMSEGAQQWHRNAFKAEMIFEERRRIVAPSAVSRLSCLWIAERTPDGVEHIQAMLGAEIYVVDVAIDVQIGLTRTDTGWFDRYINDPQIDVVDRYWMGEQCVGGETWEYLLDGVLSLEREGQLAYIREHGAKY
jgi:hypothetical protein